jgi:UrcA family protein
MNTKASTLIAKYITCLAALAACIVLSVPASADGPEVTVKISVSRAGLDVGQLTGAQKLYWRLQHAARFVCTRGDRVALEPPPNPEACREKALAEAIRSANLPRLTQIYLATHSLRQGAALGIEVPAMIAAK